MLVKNFVSYKFILFIMCAKRYYLINFKPTSDLKLLKDFVELIMAQVAQKQREVLVSKYISYLLKDCATNT